MVWPWLLFCELVQTWATKIFWVRRENLFYGASLLFSTLFWAGVIAGVMAGTAPLLGWMVSAYAAVWLSALMTWRVYERVFASPKRQHPAMLLLQLSIMIVANTIVICLMWLRGWRFQVADIPILIFALIGLALTASWIRRNGAGWDSGWALCGYATSLKSLPQLVQAVALLAGATTMPLWAATSLLLSGVSRWLLSFAMRRNNPESSDARAQVWNAGIDLGTVVLMQVGVVAGAILPF